MNFEQKEVLQDIRDDDAIKATIERGGEELLPAGVVYAILVGDSPIQLWPEHRGLTQQQLAETGGISTLHLSQLETGKRIGRMQVLLAIARTLGIDLADIVEPGR